MTQRPFDDSPQLPLRCSQCKQVIRKRQPGRRWCYVCERPIGRHDKYIFRDDGRLQHRHCNRPGSYT